MTWSRLRSIKRLIMSSVGSQLYKVQSRTISSSFNNTINGRLILLVLVTFHQEISWHYFILCWKVHCWKNYLILVANTNIFNLRDHLTNCFSTSIKKCLPTSNNFSHHCMLMLKVTGSRMSLFSEWDVMDTSSSQPHWITALRSPLYSICWMGFMCNFASAWQRTLAGIQTGIRPRHGSIQNIWLLHSKQNKYKYS